MAWLEDDVLRLRAVEPADVDLIYTVENDSYSWHTTNSNSPVSRQTLLEYVSSLTNDITQTGSTKLIAELKNDGTPVGVIDLFDLNLIDSRVEIGFYVVESERNNGYARRMVRLVAQYLSGCLGLCQMYAHAGVENPASIAVLESAGFERSGVLKNWKRTVDGFDDVAVYQLTL